MPMSLKVPVVGRRRRRGDEDAPPPDAARTPAVAPPPPEAPVAFSPFARAALLTAECIGEVPDGYAPYVCAPCEELGGGEARHGPNLVEIGPRHWRLAVAVEGLPIPVDTTVFRTGIRSLAMDDVKRGQGFAEGVDLRWTLRADPPSKPSMLSLHYYSGWAQVTARLFSGAETFAIELEPRGAGRKAGESCWTGLLPAARLQRGWGMVLEGPDGAIDRPPGGDRYRPLATTMHLADGEFFPDRPPARRSPPRIETIRCPAPELEHTFVVHVVLPRDYDELPQARYPLVFLNDGQNQLTNRGAFGGWHTDSIADRLMRAGRLRDCVLAAVEMHADRNRAYFPAGSERVVKGQADAYTDLLAGRLYQQLRRAYRLNDDPLAIVGSSNGAIHALSAGLWRPDAFDAIGCLSYAVLAPERNRAQIATLEHLPMSRVYLDSGTRWEEGDPEESSDDNLAIPAGLRDLLLQRGMVLENGLRYRLCHGDAHNEAAWRRRIGPCLEFLLPPP